MKILDPGHVYELDILDGNDDFGGNVLTFVKREGPNFPGNVGKFPGTTSQEVIRALISRAVYVNGQHPCVENDAVISLLESALLLLEVRAARKHGHALTEPSMVSFLLKQKCPTCFHINCEVHGKKVVDKKK